MSLFSLNLTKGHTAEERQQWIRTQAWLTAKLVPLPYLGKEPEDELGGGAGGREGKKGADNEGTPMDSLRIVSLRAKGLEGMESKKMPNEILGHFMESQTRTLRLLTMQIDRQLWKVGNELPSQHGLEGGPLAQPQGTKLQTPKLRQSSAIWSQIGPSIKKAFLGK